jgi:cytoskeletal protein CcmA (bactofilin family)
MVLVVLIIAFIGLSWSAAAHAQGSFRTGNDMTVPRGESLGTSLFVSGKTIDIAGNVDGDVFCLGQDVTVTGTITGDVICVGQTVNIAGHVGGNVRVAGQTVTIGGSTDRSVTVAGQDVTFDATATVGGDMTVGAQSLTLNGSVGRDLAASAPSVILSGSVGRDAQVIDNDLVLGDGSHIGGNLTYASHNYVSRASGAVVSGTIVRSEPPAQDQNHFGALIGGGFLFALYMLIALLLVALALVLLMPQLIHDATAVAVRSPWKTLLVGLLSSLLMPVLILVLLFTFIGIPLALLLLLTWIVIVCISVPFAAYYFGGLLLGKSTTRPVGTMLIGMAIILVLYMVPIVGFIVWLVATWFGLGIILLQYSRLPRRSTI